VGGRVVEINNKRIECLVTILIKSIGLAIILPIAPVIKDAKTFGANAPLSVLVNTLRHK
jgi:hypothetical protein